ncbi:hypothetical protein CFII64_28884 [Pseudomonas sp. CFII64]|uniref:hypothetical protein n=1 Tax=Pseudomonas sp. CFII64 TaxID=911242 RepID=UPI000357C021|nr:hypothetical protein [Pseudomonas sp. CFII64]EPJ75914.1 hypothetical protein CFII64_28884 [Pseudomonas sp. CFII64]
MSVLNAPVELQVSTRNIEVKGNWLERINLPFFFSPDLPGSVGNVVDQRSDLLESRLLHASMSARLLYDGQSNQYALPL